MSKWTTSQLLPNQQWDFSQFKADLDAYYESLQMTDKDIEDRRSTIKYVEAKIQNRCYDVDPSVDFHSQLSCTLFGSLICGLSTRGSDIDFSINDNVTFKKINLEVVKLNLTYTKLRGQDSRLKVLDSFLNARVPVLRLKDSSNGVEIDITTGGSGASRRHAIICRAAQKVYPNLRKLVTMAKVFLKNRGLNKTFGGGVSTFLLFYMCLGFYQNRDAFEKRKNMTTPRTSLFGEEADQVPDLVRFVEFYAAFDQRKFGIRIDLSEILPDEGYNSGVSRIVSLIRDGQIWIPKSTNLNDPQQEDYLYIKDPIGRVFYAEDSSEKLFRDNIGQSAFNYMSVKILFQGALDVIRLGPKAPDFASFMKKQGAFDQEEEDEVVLVDDDDCWEEEPVATQGQNQAISNGNDEGAQVARTQEAVGAGAEEKRKASSDSREVEEVENAEGGVGAESGKPQQIVPEKKAEEANSSWLYEVATQKKNVEVPIAETFDTGEASSEEEEFKATTQRSKQRDNPEVAEMPNLRKKKVSSSAPSKLTKPKQADCWKKPLNSARLDKLRENMSRRYK